MLTETLDKIQDYLLRRKSERHDRIKVLIMTLQTERQFSVITKKPWQTAKIEQQIKRLQKKMNGGLG